MEQEKFKDRCIIHSEEKVLFLKINNSTHKLKSQPFFTCLSCMTQNDFNLSDYFVIKDIIKGNKKILQKWPSLNNEELMKKLIEIVNEQGSSNYKNDMIDKIMSYYKNLKTLILEQLDLSQKKMIQIAEKLPQNNNAEEIIKQYQEISKLNQLRDQLLTSNIKIDDKERICTELIEQSKSQNAIQQLQSLLNTYQQKLIFNPEPTWNIIESILKNIQKIQLFQENNTIPIQSLQVNSNCDNILDLQLNYSSYNNGQNYLKISTNNSQQNYVQVQNESQDVQVVSRMIFQYNKKYVIRFKIDNLKRDSFVCVGLIQDKKIHTHNAINDEMCCYLINNGDSINKYNCFNFGIDKQLKGEGLFLSESREFELRISINDKILHLLDYPNYQYKLGLQDQYIPKLINGKDLRLIIGLRQYRSLVTITHASTVNSFD